MIKSTKHRVVAKTPTYASWAAMRHRCNNPSRKDFKSYGGRGITVCERWAKFENFLADMGERPPGLTLERSNNNDGYNPYNCRWATPKEQCNNRRNSAWLTLGGERKTLSEWAEHTGTANSTLSWRRQQHWSDFDVINGKRGSK